MSSPRLSQRLALLAGGAALLAMGTLAAGCSTKDKEAPTTTGPAPSSSTSAPLSPTEKKSVGSYSPTTVNPGSGSVCSRIVDGVCQR